MSTLLLIRHAQASFLEQNYDKLSSLGETQSTLLGGHLLNHGFEFDRVFMGPRDRQQRTCALVGRVFSDAKHDWPEPVLDGGLDEYEGEALMKKALPRLISEDKHLQVMAAQFAESEHEDKRARARRFQKMFEHVMLAWVRGEIVEEGVQPWAEFHAQIGDFLHRLRQSAQKAERVVAFTSGGSIGCAVQHALGLSHEKALELSWMVKNASITEFAFSKDRLTLSAFNSLPHLQADKLVTYR